MEYGRYIMRTGATLAAWEDGFGRYLWESRFAGRQRVLDIGPGRCWFTRQAPHAITGLELEHELVDRYRREGLRIEQGSVTAIPFPDATFDGVFCCWLFEHLDDPASAISEISRVLAPGGYACIVVPSARTIAKGFYDDFTHIRPFTSVSLDQLAHTTSFNRHRVTPLFWTRGGGRFADRVSMANLQRVLRLSDHVLRSFGLVNRGNLILEAWK